MLKEFKVFALRGNVLDLAVGIIIGGGFGKIVSSFVSDILMPPVGLLLGQVNFADLYIVLRGTVPAGTPLSQIAELPGVVTLNYGIFINNIIDFLIVAFSVFLLIKAINQMRLGKPEAPTTKKCPQCVTEIPFAAKRCPHCTSHIG